MSIHNSRLVCRRNLTLVQCGVCAESGLWEVWDGTTAAAVCERCVHPVINAERALIDAEMQHPDNQLIFLNP